MVDMLIDEIVEVLDGKIYTRIIDANDYEYGKYDQCVKGIERVKQYIKEGKNLKVYRAITADKVELARNAGYEVLEYGDGDLCLMEIDLEKEYITKMNYLIASSKIYLYSDSQKTI